MSKRTDTPFDDARALSDADWLEAATVEVRGQRYMQNARGGLTPLELIKPQDQLMDQMVRQVLGFAEDLSAQIGRFRAHTMDDISSFDALLEAEYGGHTRKSVKGNRTYMSYDGCHKLQVQVSETIAFGPELQAARDLVEECLSGWAADSRAEIRAIVGHAFKVEKEGEISRGAIYNLLRLDIDDERWKQAMVAIRDAMRVVGSKSYVRVYTREAPDAAWQPVTIDLAKAG
ncbi:DUF3164 family protein [Ruegeria sp.]|uniref:DUF3164 family protein n=1 Tax=Ruegeria sp. TaxID=1879320 RepID=UPI003B5B87F7